MYALFVADDENGTNIRAVTDSEVIQHECSKTGYRLAFLGTRERFNRVWGLIRKIYPLKGARNER